MTRRWTRSALARCLVLAAVGALAQTATASAETQGQAIVDQAAAQAGLPYCFDGGNIGGPTHGVGGAGCAGSTIGFDCTGLTLFAVYQVTGKILSHDGKQATEGGTVISDEANLQPGDLVFFGGTLSNFEHSGVYAGGGKVWDAMDYGIPVQQHTMAYIEHGLPFVGGVRLWSGNVSDPPGGSVAIKHRGAAAIANSDGRLEAFLIGNDGTLDHAYQPAPADGWSALGSIGGVLHWNGEPAIGRNANGRLEAFAIATDGSLQHAFQQSNGVWSGFGALSPAGTFPDGSIAAVATNSDGRLEAFAIGADGQLYHVFQTTPGGSWSALGAIGGVLHWNGAPAIGRNADGRLEAFAIANDGSLQHAFQQTNGTWSGFGALSPAGVFPDGSIAAVATNSDGRLEAFAIGADGQLYHVFQTTPGGSWSALGAIGGVLHWNGAPAIGRNADGRLEAFAIANDGSLQHTFQGTDGTWAGFGALSPSGLFPDGTIASVASNADGRLEAFAMGADAQLYHAFQTTPGGSWSATGLVPFGTPAAGAPAPAPAQEAPGVLTPGGSPAGSEASTPQPAGSPAGSEPSTLQTTVQPQTQGAAAAPLPSVNTSLPLASAGPALTASVVIVGRQVKFSSFTLQTRTSKACPATAKVVATGRGSIATRLKVARASGRKCDINGTLTLPKRLIAGRVAVKVTITGTNLRTAKLSVSTGN